MYRITLEDGTVLDNLELNGNNYISETLISDSVFEGNLGTVEIYDGETTQVHENMKLIANQVFSEKSWFIIEQKTQQDIEREMQEQRINALEQENLRLQEVIDTMLGQPTGGDA